MNRRSFLTRLACSALAVPSFVRAASLWLPPERPFVPDTIYPEFDHETHVLAHTAMLSKLDGMYNKIYMDHYYNVVCLEHRDILACLKA